MNREVHVRIWERPAVRILRATRHEERFPPSRRSVGFGLRKETIAGGAAMSEMRRFRPFIWPPAIGKTRPIAAIADASRVVSELKSRPTDGSLIPRGTS